MSELLSCPFCGSHDVEVQGKPAILDALDSVCCNECSADAPYPVWNTRAQLPSQGGEAVEVVASIAVDAEGVVRDFTLEPGLNRHPGGYTVTPLMTVAQHQRILAVATHPADQVGEAVAWLTSDKRHLVFSGALDQSQYVEQGMTPLYTHPADQVAEGVAVPVQLLKIIEQSWRIPNGCPKSVSEEVGEIISNGLAELRALLASAEGGSE